MKKSSRLMRAAPIAVWAALLFPALFPALARGATLKGTVSDASGDPIQGATVLVVENQRGTTTGGAGTYSMRVSAGQYLVLVSAPDYSIAENLVTVAAGEARTLDFSLNRELSLFGEELVVIGSRATRSAIETPVPVDVLNQDEILATGLTETSRIIQFLAPSFNHSTSAISDGTDIVRPSTLRGLGPDQTLVLINGKRRHNSALVHVNGSIGRGTSGVDLNAIPASAIERIEVLRDGAAAQYGSDAIAGVINVVLKTTAEGSRVSTTGGQHFAGDGEVFQLSLNHGWRLQDSGFLNVSAEIRQRGATNRAGEDPRRIFNFLEQEFGQPALSSGTLDPREATYDRLNHRYGDADSENLYLFLNSSIPLSDTRELYFFGGLSEREGESGGFNRLPSESRTSILLHPEGHLPLINSRVDDLSLSAGLRQNISNRWFLDAGVTTGGNDFNFFISNSANTSLGADSPTEADAGTLRFARTTLNFDFLGTVGQANVAFGAEWRQDRFEIEAGEPASWTDGLVADQFGGRAPAGIQVFPGFRPANEVDESRRSMALYGDVEFNISEKFLIAVAARFEDFSDFGSTLDGKLALRYAWSERTAFRAALSTGFRAPSLHQSLFNNISTQFVDVGGELTPLEVGTFRVDSPVAQALGAQSLREETSTSLSAGVTLRPRDNLSITLDTFKIDIDDRIVISGRFAASNPRIAPLLEPFGVNAAQFFTNAINTETEGVDLVVAWSKEAGGGTLSLTGAANWNKTEVVGAVDTPPRLAGLGETLFPRIDRTYIELGQPRELYNLSARYTRSPFAVLVRFNKFGAVASTESNTDPDRFQTFGGKWLTDLDLSYQIKKTVQVSVGGNNIFDVYPDENIASNSFNGIFVYPRRTAPFGFNGGAYYVRLTFDF